jgi:pyruvate kinase
LILPQGPEIRTGFLKNPDVNVKLESGKEIMITTDYTHKGDENMIAMRCLLPALRSSASLAFCE